MKEKQRRLKESDSPLETLRIERTALSQEDFAKKCGIPWRTYQRWIYGETEGRLTLKQLKAMCRELNIESIGELPDDFAPSHKLVNHS